MEKETNNTILLSTSFSFPHLGGLSTGLCYETSYFAKKGYKVFVVYTPSEISPESILMHDDNICLIPQVNVPTKGILGRFIHIFVRVFRHSFVIRKLTQTNDVQCIHAHDVYCALSCILAGQRTKTVLHLHSIASIDRFTMIEHFSTLSVKRKILFLINFIRDFILEFIVYNLVRLIICVSEYEWQDARKKSRPKNKILILRNGIDTNLFRPKPEMRKELRHKMNIDGDTIVCMYLGRMVPKNGPILIAEAIPFINLKASKVLFIYVGDGIEKKKVINYVQSKNISNVLFIDGMHAKDILPIADIFVSHVSSDVDGHGQTILEAMASGIPTISGKDTIKEKVFREDEELLLVDKDNPNEIARAVLSLLFDEKKRKRLSVNGMRKVQRDLSLETSMKKIEDIFKSLRKNYAETDLVSVK